MAKKLRLEQVDLENINVRNYAFISNLLKKNVVVNEDENGAYITGNHYAFYMTRFTSAKFKENTSYTLFFRGYDTASTCRFHIKYTDGTADFLFFTTTLSNRSFITPANKTIDYIAGTYGTTSTFFLYNLLLIEGTHFPGWIPAPEDQVSDWNVSNPLLYSYIKNKPNIPPDYGDFRDYGLGTEVIVQDPQPYGTVQSTGLYRIGANPGGVFEGLNNNVPYLHLQANANRYGRLFFRTAGGIRLFYQIGGSTSESSVLGLWDDSNFDPTEYATTNEINNIYDQLSAKANTRLSNVVSDLSEVEKKNIRHKIGIEKTSNYLDTDHLNNYGSGFFSGLVVDYSFFSDGRQEPDGKLYISALAEDGSYIGLERDVTEFSRHVVTQVGVSNVLVAEGIIKTSYNMSEFTAKSRDVHLVVLYDSTVGVTPLWKSVSSIKEIRENFTGTAWLIGKLFSKDNEVFFNVYPQII